MTDKPSAKGWIVRVTTKRLGDGPPSVEIDDVAITDAVDAIKTVRRVCGAGPDTIVETIGELPPGPTCATGKSSSADSAKEAT